MARPTKLTPDTTKRLVDALSLTATYKLACLYAGISEQTLITWRKRGQAAAERQHAGKPISAASAPYLTLFESLQKAEGEAAIGLLAKIEKAANEGAWQAAAWKLERRYPDEYGRQITDLRHSGKIDGPPTVSVFRFPARAQTASQWHLTHAPGQPPPPHEEP